MKDIAEAVKERRAMILRLQNEVEVLERARALLNGVAADTPRTLEVLLGERLNLRETRGARARRQQAGHPMKGKVNPKSAVGHALAVLRESGVPLHINEIMARMKKRGAEPKKGSLVSTLMKLDKRQHIFFKSEQPSTFGLIEWRQAAVKAASG